MRRLSVSMHVTPRLHCMTCNSRQCVHDCLLPGGGQAGSAAAMVQSEEATRGAYTHLKVPFNAVGLHQLANAALVSRKVCPFHHRHLTRHSCHRSSCTSMIALGPSVTALLLALTWPCQQTQFCTCQATAKALVADVTCWKHHTIVMPSQQQQRQHALTCNGHKHDTAHPATIITFAFGITHTSASLSVYCLVAA